MIEEKPSPKERDPVLALVLLHMAVDHNCFTWIENGVPEFMSREEFLKRSEERKRKKHPSPKRKVA